jgi:hypothetical protein
MLHWSAAAGVLALGTVGLLITFTRVRLTSARRTKEEASQHARSSRRSVRKKRDKRAPRKGAGGEYFAAGRDSCESRDDDGERDDGGEHDDDVAVDDGEGVATVVEDDPKGEDCRDAEGTRAS